MISAIGSLEPNLDRAGGPEAGGTLRGALAPASDVSDVSFVDALREAATSTVGTLQHAEKASLQALQGGEIQTREVVDAVMSAEQSLQAAIAIRDKIVTAYLEISRMAI